MLVVAATLLIGTYQLSLYFVQKEQTTRNTRMARTYANWAVRLAPGAFDPLYVRAAAALSTQPVHQAAPAVEALYNRYPYVPVVLQMIGTLRAQQGKIAEARQFLGHAIANDPQNTAAKQLLDQLP